MIGTIGAGSLMSISYNGLTTPGPIEVHRLLANWRDSGVTQVCMEVSSHALDQGRVAGVRFYGTSFTNLSHDHLDYHGDMRAYAAAKARLFHEYPSELTVTNVEDELGRDILDLAKSDFIVSYGEGGDVQVAEWSVGPQGISLHIEANGVDFEITTPLIGKINVPNILLLVATLLSLSVPIEEIQVIAAQLKPAPGRMELYSADSGAKVVVDFAHTPDALEKALISVKEHCSGNLWCVFGCGGDRDQAKRPIMGAVAAKYSDRVIVTNDNPRSEAPSSITDGICVGIEAFPVDHLQIILDRAEAIEHAIEHAGPEDWVLIAGRGHEHLQQIGQDFLPFSDREHVSLLVSGETV
jgi:UDP-N-acetylmuramoyl-L-alanyl-D-glutamate--2,6-diaminopimelate ligase